jgi:CDP-glycerol glycerophosphotransferase (TagB/SpsB family)
MKILFLKYLIVPIIQIIDFILTKKKNYWGFSVHHIKSDQFIENARAVFEEIKKDNSIHKILFTRDNTVNYNIEDVVNFTIVNIKSIKGIYLILKCKVLFVTHSVSMDYAFRFEKSKFCVLKLNFKKRIIVNLWHGTPIKKLYALWNLNVKKKLDRVKYRHFERKNYAGLITSSNIDSYAMSTMFHPIKYDNIWITGLPKNDFLLLDKDKLPFYLREQLKLVESIKSGKKLILYAPTYRQSVAVKDAFYYKFTEEEISTLKNLLINHNAIFGFRMHYFRNDLNLFNIEDYIDNKLIFNLGHNLLPEISPILRASDYIISDYSSVFIEALYINKPVFSFAYDKKHYSENQDGLLYNDEIIFPGVVTELFSDLIKTLDEELKTARQINTDKYKISQKFFFNNIDTNNSARVVEKVKNIIFL